MIKNNIKISGSFILEGINGSEYNGDIDFYIDSTSHQCESDDMTISFYKEFLEKFCNSEINNYSDVYFIDNDNQFSINDQIMRIINMFVTHKKISFIFLRNKLEEHIKCYDIDIVKNIYYYNIKKKRFSIIIENLYGIYNKEMSINVISEHINIQSDRIRKYMNRKFRVNCGSLNKDAKVTTSHRN